MKPFGRFYQKKIRVTAFKPLDSDRLSTPDTNPFTLRNIVPLSPTSTLCNHSGVSSGLRSTDTVHPESSTLSTSEETFCHTKRLEERFSSIVHTADRSTETRYSTPSILIAKTNRVSIADSNNSILTMYSDHVVNKIFTEQPCNRCARPTGDAIKGGWKRKWKWLTKAWDKPKEVKSPSSSKD